MEVAPLKGIKAGFIAKEQGIDNPTPNESDEKPCQGSKKIFLLKWCFHLKMEFVI